MNVARSLIHGLTDQEQRYIERLAGLGFEDFRAAWLRAAGERVVFRDARSARLILRTAAEMLRVGTDPSNPDHHPVYVAEVIASKDLDPWPADMNHVCECAHAGIIEELGRSIG